MNTIRPGALIGALLLASAPLVAAQSVDSVPSATRATVTPGGPAQIRLWHIGVALAGTALAALPARAEVAIASSDMYPAKRNDAYKLDRAVTPEKTNLTYNNFYEFTTSKHVDADALRVRPWTVTVGGLVEKQKTWDIDDLIRWIGVGYMSSARG